MECIYFDKNSIVWEFPREIQDSLFFTGNNEMFNIYHKRLKNIYEIVINSVNKDNVKLLYNGMPFVEIKKQYTKGMIFNNLFINNNNFIGFIFITCIIFTINSLIFFIFKKFFKYFIYFVFHFIFLY